MTPDEQAVRLAKLQIDEIEALVVEVETAAKALVQCREQALERDDAVAAELLEVRLDGLLAAARSLPEAVRDVMKEVAAQ